MEFILLIVVIVLWRRHNRLKRQLGIDLPPEPKPREPTSPDQMIALAMIAVAVGVIWLASYMGL